MDNLAGPIGGFGSDVDKLTRGNILRFMQGKETHVGAEGTRFTKRYLLPGANMWWGKAALDRLVFSDMQEYFSPGYLARAQAHSRNLYGTSYWWRPGAPLSQVQAPDLSTIMKEK